MKQIMLLSALLGLIGLNIPAVRACECDGKKSPRQGLRKAKAVFVGEIVEIKDRESSAIRLIKFKVEKYWKGVKGEFITISSPGGMCGMNFKLNEEWLVYAYSDDLYTDNCRRTALLTVAAEDIQKLGKTKEL